MKIPKYYGEAKKQGWIDSDSTLARGYVSARADPQKAPIYYSGDVGRRAGWYYVELHNPKSTQHLVRMYIVPPKNIGKRRKRRVH